jgi:REP element-mobilizing transposase RayT
MPDHIHLFCAPGTLPPTSVKKWVEYWKGSVSRALKGHGPLAEYGRGGTRPSTPADSPPPSSTPGGTASTPSDSRDHGRGGTRPSTPCVPGDDGEDENRPSQWPETLWQRDCWDTQLRRGESYRAKWEYVLDNPVRAGLCESPDEWPYLGEMNVLQWHD